MTFREERTLLQRFSFTLFQKKLERPSSSKIQIFPIKSHDDHPTPSLFSTPPKSSRSKDQRAKAPSLLTHSQTNSGLSQLYKSCRPSNRSSHNCSSSPTKPTRGGRSKNQTNLERAQFDSTLAWMVSDRGFFFKRS